MNPEIQKLQTQVDELQRRLNLLEDSSTISFETEQAFRQRLLDLFPNLPEGFDTAPLTAITAPTGGAVVDSQARTAINLIITAMEDLGLLNPN